MIREHKSIVVHHMTKTDLSDQAYVCLCMTLTFCFCNGNYRSLFVNLSNNFANLLLLDISWYNLVQENFLENKKYKFLTWKEREYGVIKIKPKKLNNVN